MLPYLSLEYQHYFRIQWHWDGFSSFRLVGVYPCATAIQINLRPFKFDYIGLSQAGRKCETCHCCQVIWKLRDQTVCFLWMAN